MTDKERRRPEATGHGRRLPVVTASSFREPPRPGAEAIGRLADRHGYVALSDKLLTEDTKATELLIRFDVSELVRVDEKERSEVYARSIAAGGLAPQ